MFITFINIKVNVHFEFIPQGQRVNQVYYVEIMKWLCQAVCRKRSERWPNNWILHHDNVPAYKALFVKQFQAQKLINRIEHPSYSPD
jgi:hypothetical protein